MRLKVPTGLLDHYISCAAGGEKGVPGDYCYTVDGCFPAKIRLTH